MELLLTDYFGIERSLYLVRAGALTDWKSALSERRLPDEADAGIALLLVTDGTTAGDGVLARLAAYCRRHGVHWLSVWGPGSKRVADAFAVAACDLDVGPRWGLAVARDEPALALWHDTSLEEALEVFWEAALVDLDRPADRRRSVGIEWRRPVRIVFVSGPERAAWADEVREATHAVLNF